MTIVLIAAHAPDLVIGRAGKLPWHYPQDLKHFKARTSGHTVLMGRGVFEEIGCKPLPKRRNVVITSRQYEGVSCFPSIEEALMALKDEQVLYVIGGGQIYRSMMNMANRLEITEIPESYNGDVFFPEYRDEIGTTWQEVSRISDGGLSFVDYQRIVPV